MDTLIQTLGLGLGAAWTSGVRLYVTVAVLGLLAHYHLARLPGSLGVLDNWLVIGVALSLVVVELVADKIPYVDSAWDAVHTFVRVPAGAVIAASAVADFSPTVRVLALLLGGGLALSSHGAKATLRAGVNVSPEPVTNWIVSCAEDVFAVGAAALAVLHPLAILVIIAFFLLLLAWLLPKVVRRVRRMLRAARNLFAGHVPAGSAGE